MRLRFGWLFYDPTSLSLRQAIPKFDAKKMQYSHGPLIILSRNEHISLTPQPKLHKNKLTLSENRHKDELIDAQDQRTLAPSLQKNQNK